MGTLKCVASIQIDSGGEQSRGHSVVIQNVYTSICVDSDRAGSEYFAILNLGYIELLTMVP